MSRVKIFLKCILKIPVTYFEVEWRVERRKHKSRFSEIKRKNKGTRRRNAARKRNPWTFASLLLRAVRNTCMGDKYKCEHIKPPKSNSSHVIRNSTIIYQWKRKGRRRRRKIDNMTIRHITSLDIYSLRLPLYPVKITNLRHPFCPS